MVAISSNVFHNFSLRTEVTSVMIRYDSTLGGRVHGRNIQKASMPYGITHEIPIAEEAADIDRVLKGKGRHIIYNFKRNQRMGFRNRSVLNWDSSLQRVRKNGFSVNHRFPFIWIIIV